jgi:hypothetical protein
MVPDSKRSGDYVDSFSRPTLTDQSASRLDSPLAQALGDAAMKAVPERWHVGSGNDCTLLCSSVDGAEGRPPIVPLPSAIAISPRVALQACRYAVNSIVL